MARQKKEITTLSELKTYIAGAVEFNPPEWVPSAEQWEMIVDMIMGIKEVEPAPFVHQSTNHPPQPDYNVPTAHVQPSAMDVEEPQQMTPQIDASQNPDARPQVENTGMGVSEKDPVTGAVSSGLKFKTPNVDTSEGKPYESGFK